MADGHRIEETIEFLTQVHAARDGTEQRHALREKPRRSISYRFTGTADWKSSYLRALIFSEQTTRIEFPLWNAITKVPVSLWAGQSQIPLSKTDMWGYRDCHGVMLWQGDDGYGSESFKLQGITADGKLRLAKQLSTNWEDGTTFTIPVFYGNLNQEDSYANVTASNADVNINVEIIPTLESIILPQALDEYNYPRLDVEEALNAPVSYLGLELFLMPPSWREDEEISYQRNAYRLDNNTGAFKYDLKSVATIMTRTIEFIAYSKEHIHFLQRFFYRCKGQWKAFYMPTWSSDIQLVADAPVGNAELLVKLTHYYKFYTKQKRRRTLVVFFYDGTIEIITIAGFSLSNDAKFGKIYLKNALKRNLIRNEIRMISFLVKCRHSTDSMVIDYETTDAANITFTVQEVDD